MSLISWIEKGWLPDTGARLYSRITSSPPKKEATSSYEDRTALLYRFRDQLQNEPIAYAVKTANTQHYEVPADLFKTFMGPHLKYSSGYWSDKATTLAESEKRC